MIGRLTARFFVLLWCLTLTACFTSLPSTLQISVEERGNAVYLYRLFREENCGIPLDSDISIDIQSFGKHIKASGYMQLQPPKNCRITIVDTGGRPFYILTAADDELTLINSMKGEVQIGSVSALLRDLEQDIHLDADQVIPLLTGRFLPDPSCLLDVSRDKQHSGLMWLVFSSDAGRKQHVLFDAVNSRIQRHLIVNDSDDIELDIKYSWSKINKGECAVPVSLNITSDNVVGEAELNYDLVLRPQKIPDKTFQFSLPEHYPIITIE